MLGRDFLNIQNLNLIKKHLISFIKPCICMMLASTYFKHAYFAFPAGGKFSIHN